jgi:hypothetical protein
MGIWEDIEKLTEDWKKDSRYVEAVKNAEETRRAFDMARKFMEDAEMAISQAERDAKVAVSQSIVDAYREKGIPLVRVQRGSPKILFAKVAKITKRIVTLESIGFGEKTQFNRSTGRLWGRPKVYSTYIWSKDLEWITESYGGDSNVTS